MSRAKTKPVYHGLVIVATCSETEIWLGDDRGHFVQKGAGTLRTSLLPGNYTIEFGLLAPLNTRSVSRGRVVTRRQNWLRGQPALVVFLNWTAQSSVMAETHPADAAEGCGGVMPGVRRMGNESRR